MSKKFYAQYKNEAVNSNTKQENTCSYTVNHNCNTTPEWLKVGSKKRNLLSACVGYCEVKFALHIPNPEN